VRTNAPDAWLDLKGTDLQRRLVTTGSQSRATMFDVLGRQSTKHLNSCWAQAERWKQLDDVWTERPRNRLRHLDDLLVPLITRERLKVQVKDANGRWLPLTVAAANPRLVI